jgi:uncharacterized protein (DUF2384 family)
VGDVEDPSARSAARLARARAVVRRLEQVLLEADDGNTRLSPAVREVRRVLGGGAPRWWSQPAFGLEGRVPREVAVGSAEGCDRVISLLGQIETGTLA